MAGPRSQTAMFSLSLLSWRSDKGWFNRASAKLPPLPHGPFRACEREGTVRLREKCDPRYLGRVRMNHRVFQVGGSRSGSRNAFLQHQHRDQVLSSPQMLRQNAKNEELSRCGGDQGLLAFCIINFLRLSLAANSSLSIRSLQPWTSE